jgi:transcription initiation factor TFIID TATA-box-binding protein
VTSYTIDNIIASTNLNTKLRLKEISEKLENSEYNPDNYPGVIWRPRNTPGVVVIMQDGRMMCTNVRSVEDVEKLFENLIKKMEELALITPRLACPNCGAVVDSEDVVCIECGHLLQGG